MGEKSCENCYKKHSYMPSWCTRNNKKPVENVCNEHSFKCKCEDIARYKYKGNRFCKECILREFRVEECITIEYYLDGEYLGNLDDIDEVVKNIDNDIKRIED